MYPKRFAVCRLCACYVLLLIPQPSVHVVCQVCANATIYASGPVWSIDFAAANVLSPTWQGAAANNGQTWLTPNAQNSWFQLELGQSSRVTEFHLLNTCNYPYNDRATNGYRITVSVDSTNWVVAAEGQLSDCSTSASIINGDPMIIGNGGPQDGINYVMFETTSYHSAGGGLNYFAACESSVQYRLMSNWAACDGGSWAAPAVYAYATGGGGTQPLHSISREEAIRSGIYYCASVFAQGGYSCSREFIAVANNNGHCYCLPPASTCDQLVIHGRYQFRRQLDCDVTVTTAYKSVQCSNPGYDNLVSIMSTNSQPTGYCSVQDVDLEQSSTNRVICGGTVNSWLCKRFSWSFSGGGTWEWRNLASLDFGYGVLILDGKEILRGHSNLFSWSVTVGLGSHSVDLVVYEECCDGDRYGWHVFHPSTCMGTATNTTTTTNLTTTTTTQGQRGVALLPLEDADPDLKGYHGGFIDATYAYLVPWKSPDHPGTGHFGKVARFAISDFSSVTVLDVEAVQQWLKGFRGGFTDGTYGYLVPGMYNNAVRFSLATFDAVETNKLTLKDPNLRGFFGGFSDGIWGYYVPNSIPSNGNFKGKVCRVSLADFSTTQSLNLASTDADLKGFCGGFADGGFGYVVPRSNGVAYNGVPFGKVARFSLSNSYFNLATVTVLDLESIDPTLVGFSGGFSDHVYGYVMPRKSGKVVRFSLADFSTVEVLDLAGLAWDLSEFFDGFSDGLYGYAVPRKYGLLPRFSLYDFSSIQVLDLIGINPALDAASGGFVQGTYGYLVPWGDSGRNGIVTRFHLEDNEGFKWPTTTTNASTTSTTTNTTTTSTTTTVTTNTSTTTNTTAVVNALEMPTTNTSTSMNTTAAVSTHAFRITTTNTTTTMNTTTAISAHASTTNISTSMNTTAVSAHASNNPTTNISTNTTTISALATTLFASLLTNTTLPTNATSASATLTMKANLSSTGWQNGSKHSVSVTTTTNRTLSNASISRYEVFTTSTTTSNKSSTTSNTSTSAASILTTTNRTLINVTIQRYEVITTSTIASNKNITTSNSSASAGLGLTTITNRTLTNVTMRSYEVIMTSATTSNRNSTTTNANTSAASSIYTSTNRTLFNVTIARYDASTTSTTSSNSTTTSNTSTIVAGRDTTTANRTLINVTISWHSTSTTTSNSSTSAASSSTTTNRTFFNVTTGRYEVFTTSTTSSNSSTTTSDCSTSVASSSTSTNRTFFNVTTGRYEVFTTSTTSSNSSTTTSNTSTIVAGRVTATLNRTVTNVTSSRHSTSATTSNSSTSTFFNVTIGRYEVFTTSTTSSNSSTTSTIVAGRVTMTPNRTLTNVTSSRYSDSTTTSNSSTSAALSLITSTNVTLTNATSSMYAIMIARDTTINRTLTNATSRHSARTTTRNISTATSNSSTIVASRFVTTANSTLTNVTVKHSSVYPTSTTTSNSSISTTLPRLTSRYSTSTTTSNSSSSAAVRFIPKTTTRNTTIANATISTFASISTSTTTNRTLPNATMSKYATFLITSASNTSTSTNITTTLTSRSSPTTAIAIPSTSITLAFGSSTSMNILNQSTDLGASLQQHAAVLLESLANQSLTMVMTATGVVAAVKLETLPKIEGDDGVIRVEASVPGSHVKAAIPANLLSDLGSDTAALFAVYSQEAIQATMGSSPQYTQNGIMVEIDGVVTLELHSLDGQNHVLENLSEQILLTLAVNSSSNTQCQFWDGQKMMWSVSGVATGLDKDGRLQCIAEHLSMFGAASGDFGIASTATTRATTATASIFTTTKGASDVVDLGAALAPLSQVQVDEAMSFLGENQSSAVVETESVLVMAVRMETASPTKGDDNIPRVEAEVPGSDVKASVPISLLKSIGEDVAGVLTIYTDDAIQTAIGGSQFVSSDGSKVEVVGVVSFELRKLGDGSLHNVQGLSEPIFLTLPINFTNSRMQCQYWDEEEEVWSAHGVSTDVDDSGKVVCVITHLSIFGAVSRGFVDALACANFGMFTWGALKEIFVGNWWYQTASIAFWILLIVHVLAFGAALYVDRFVEPWHGGKSRDDSFITENIAYKKDRHNRLEEIRHDFVHGFEYLVKEIHLAVSKRAPCCRVLEIVVVWLLAKCVRICFAYDYGIHNKDVKRVAKKTSKILRKDSEMQRQGTIQRLSSGPSIMREQSELNGFCVTLTNDMELKLDGFHRMMMARLSDYFDMVETEDAKLGSFLERAWIFFAAMHPLLSLTHHSTYQPASLRVLLFAARVFGCLMLSGVFFQASGQASTKGAQPECDFSNIFATLVIALISSVIAYVPIVIILSMHTRDMVFIAETDKRKRQLLLAKWQIEDGCMWLFGGLYTLASQVFTMSFLANISVEDHNEFLIAVAYTGAKMLVLMPLLLSSILAAVTYVGVWNPELIERARIKLNVPRQVNSTKDCSLDALEEAVAASEYSRNDSRSREEKCDPAVTEPSNIMLQERASSRGNSSDYGTTDDIAHEYLTMEISDSENATNRQQNDCGKAVHFRTSVSGLDNELLNMFVNHRIAVRSDDHLVRPTTPPRPTPKTPTAPALPLTPPAHKYTY